MRFSDLVQMSISNLLKRKIRTLLTVLGVVIGTTSIVVMLSLGIGLKQGMLDQIQEYASLTRVEVNAKSNYDENNKKINPEDIYLTDDVVQRISELEHVVSVSPQLSISVLLKDGKYVCYTTLVGLTQKGLEEKKFEFATGEIPTSQTELSFVLGNGLPTDFYVERTGRYPYMEDGIIPVNLAEDRLSVIYNLDAYYEYESNKNSVSQDSLKGTAKKPKNYPVRVSGILVGEVEDWSWDSSRVYCDMDALIKQLKKEFKGKTIPGQPTTKAGKPYKKIFYSQLDVEVDDMKNVAAVTRQITDMGYEAYNNAEWIQSEMEQMNMIQAVLGAIGAVSFLVAAIGIANTMMMSIYERTKEIGIMKVLGCDLYNIQGMFLLEAGLIGMIGGIVGMLVSYVLSFVVNHLSLGGSFGVDTISVIPLWLPLPAVVFAMLMGMLAGFPPSLRAMKLSPLMAMQSQ